jgi:sugar O-acyltransferase (sialic acid O-acetyltransferase NeuD family)
MKPLLVVAAGGLAREALETIRAQATYDVIGLIDDDPTRHGELIGGDIKVLGGLEAVVDHPDAQVIICAGKGTARAALAGRLAIRDGQLATVVHPSVAVPGSCSIGPGSVALAGCVLTADVTIGRHVVVMPHVTVTHDDVIDDFATLCAGAILGGGVTVGAGAYVGMGASIRENLRIGAGAVVGMGAVVLRDVPDGQIWAGNPARPLPSGGHALDRGR